MLQEVELVEKLFEVTEHRARCYRNRLSGEVIAAAWPAQVVKAGLVGPRLSALIGYQKGACHMSFTSIQHFFDNVLHLPISRGYLVKVVQKISAALSDGYEELRGLLPQQRIINIDENRPSRERQEAQHLGLSRSRPTRLHLLPHRSLAQRRGAQAVFGRDLRRGRGLRLRRHLPQVPRRDRRGDAVLLAHLIRDVKFLTTLPDKVTCRYGEKLLGEIKRLFRAWHRRETTTPRRWQREAARAQQGILKVVRRAPARSEAQNIAQRFRDYGRYYFTFLERPGVEPTNNRMEQKFRPLVIDRKITQGTRGEAGRRWCERIWTALATCAQRGRRAFAYLCEAIGAYLRGQVGPSLLAMPP